MLRVLQRKQYDNEHAERVSDESIIKNNTWNSNQRDAYTANFYLIKFEGEL